ncbi:MAG: O-antigen ligase domain-containing protein [Planctomycetes bacterium]|nr:O-antigen ligase domain-containing protein [Planctomycetota bacterium]
MGRPLTELDRLAAQRPAMSPLPLLVLTLAAFLAACGVAWAATGGVKWEAVALLTILSAAGMSIWLNLVDRFLDFTTWLLLFCAPITLDVQWWTRLGDDPIVNTWPASATLSIPDLLTWFLYAAWGLELWKRRGATTLSNSTQQLGWIAVWAFGFIVAGAASFRASRDPISSAIEWWHTLHYVLMFFYLAKRVRDPKLLQWLLISIALQCWIEVGMSTLQYVTKSSLGLEFLGERAGVKTFDTPDGAEARAGGLMVHPNNLALYFVAVGPVSMAKALQPGLHPLVRLFWLATAVLTQFGLLITFSRAGWLCSATCALLIFHWQQRRLGRPLVVSLFLPIFSGIALFVGLFLLWPDFRDRLLAPDYGSTETRWQQWKTAIEVIRHSWWEGTGLGAYTDGAWKWNAGEGDLRNLLYRVHNGSLLVTAELGIWGGIAYHAWAFLVLRRGWQLVRTLRDPVLWSAAAGLFAGLLGWYAKSMYNVHTPIADVNLWYLSALLLAVPYCGARDDTTAASTPRVAP